MALTADIDGSSITSLCQSIRWRPRLSAPATGIVRVPAHLVSVTPGVSELHIYSGGTLVFSGPVWYTQADGDPNATYAEITAFDHLIYLQKRLCKTATGNLITPGSVILSEVTAPSILAAYINNTLSVDGAMPLSVGSVAGGGADVSGAPTSFPMSIDNMRALMVSTGQVDVLVNPGVGGSTVDLTNGDGGNDLSGSVFWQYGTGAYNCQVATFTQDMDVVINALWYLLGPRCSETRWRGSITPTAPHVGGTWPPSLVSRFMGSRSTYGYMQEIRIFDDSDGDCNDPSPVGENAVRDLFEEEWANEAWIRATPRVFASIRPERGQSPNFAVGDLITVSAGSQLLGGFSGAQRVYEMEVECDADGIVSITEIITSADQEGAP